MCLKHNGHGVGSVCKPTSPPQIRESVINRFILAKHHYRLSDMVVEEEIPSIG